MPFSSLWVYSSSRALPCTNPFLPASPADLSLPPIKGFILSSNFFSSLERAIFETLAYSDVFDYPLTLDELHRYLTFPALKDELLVCLKSLSTVSSRSGFYFLAHHDALVEIRLTREAVSRPAFRRALSYGRILGALPFVRMAALTGSLAVLNLSKKADMDYFLITQPGRLWLARAFAVTFGRFMRLFDDRICVNLLVSENQLEWNAQDLYSAREMCQMIPITGMDVYLELRERNAWTESFLPNALSAPQHAPDIEPFSGLVQRLSEFIFWGKLGDLLESWVMNLQLKKITRTYGSGLEAHFSADLCQGNFHDHRTGTEQSFQERLAVLNEGEPRS